MTKSTQKTAAVIIIGNEILSGRTQDQNLAYIGQRLARLGIVLAESLVIPDVEEIIINRVKTCADHYDYVFTTGGIGPTHDDITTAAIAKAFARQIKRDPLAVEAMARHYGDCELTDSRLKMADLPEGASLIDNPISGAPAFQLDNVFVLAGVPSIMRAMFDGLVGRLCPGAPILAASVTTNLTESVLADGLASIQDACVAVSIGSYPYFKQGVAGVNIVLRATDQALLRQQTTTVEQFVKEIGGVVLEMD